MIPKNIITKEHVLASLSEIDANGVPENRQAKGFNLVYNDKLYPPKYVISLATRHARGSGLHPSEFSGGEQTNSFLRDLGFEVVAREHQSVRDGLEKVLERYVKARTSETFGKEHELWDVFVELRKSLKLFDSIHDNQHVKVESSIGQGNWNKVPWIALLDDRETDTTQRGVYCVFLFRQDMTGVYLTLAQGVTEPQKRMGAHEARQFLKSNADTIRGYIGELAAAGFNLDNSIQLNADPGLGADYADSVIAYKPYEKGSVPDDDTIEADVGHVLAAYQKYIDTKGGPVTDQKRSWMFQANPKFYDIMGALQVLKQQTWLAPVYQKEIHAGDRVYLWEAGEHAGIIGSATVLTEPAEIPFKDDEKPFTKDEKKFAGLQTRVLLQIDCVLPNRLRKRDLLDDDVLKALMVIRFPRAGTFKVTPEEAARIEELMQQQLGTPPKPETPLGQLAKMIYFSTSQLEEIESLLLDKRQLIFEGPPGSGKTYVAQLFARYFAGVPLEGPTNMQVRIIQFHQSYGYEDFVEGIRPKTNSGQIEYVVLPGIFKRLCEDAGKDPEKRFVVVIDEINRGNISRIFGELLMLLEYRNLEVELPYEKDGNRFSIPPNVFVIGTMNTTDRSLAQIDYALRRRFFFYRLMPVVAGTAPVLKGWLDAQPTFTPAE